MLGIESGSTEDYQNWKAPDTALKPESKSEVSVEVREASEKIGVELLELAENPVGTEGRLEFHNKEHTEGVAERTREIMTRMKDGGVDITVRDILIAVLAAKGHDTVQRGESVDLGLGGTMFKRFREANEKDSADLLGEKMEDAGVFTKVEVQQVKAVIYEGTVPSEGIVDGTIVQPGLTAESSPMVRALALADLGEAGINPEAFIKGGDALFRETFLDMQNLGFEKLSYEDKHGLYGRMLGWSKFQVSFAEGRKSRFEEELGNIPDKAKENLRALFNRFDDSIQAAADLAEEREKMTPEELYEDMGFKIPKEMQIAAK